MALKKLFASILLLVFVYTLFGYYPVFLFLQNNIKKEIKSRIKLAVPDSELQLIIVNESNIAQVKWFDKNEFLLDGNLYDVVRIENNKQGEPVYYCINDKQEMKLFTNLGKLIQNAFDGKTNNKKNQSPVKNLVKDYLPNSSITFYNFPVQDIRFELYAEKEEVDFSGISSPPPQAS